MPLLLALLFIVVPIAELYVIWQVGGLIGILPTVALLLAASIAGGVLLRSQGRAAWRRFVTALQSGRPPAREVADGALIIFGAALLLTPGFITDTLGVALLLPPTRALVRGTLVRTLAPRLVAGAAGRWGRPGGARRPRGPAQPGGRSRHGSDADVEGTAHEVDDGPQRPRRP
ncbi:MAG: FxsA family protein [Solirubrobacteraceae bacterium MAG38_C4-C5]|nr:FxsA family protein [Candidatus Siliceabacter maunaloa]